MQSRLSMPAQLNMPVPHQPVIDPAEALRHLADMVISVILVLLF
jgi:hypothetical protein